MWCLVLTGPCCCGPCQARISTGARIVFLINIVIFFSAIIYTAVFYTSPAALDLGKDKAQWATTLPLLTQNLKCLIGHYFDSVMIIFAGLDP